MNKFGTYISNLMSTVLDSEQEQFVKDLAWNELKRINADVEEFLRTQKKDDSEERDNTEKTLLQEEKNDN